MYIYKTHFKLIMNVVLIKTWTKRMCSSFLILKSPYWFYNNLLTNQLFSLKKIPMWQEKSNKVFDSRQPPMMKILLVSGNVNWKKKVWHVLSFLYHFFANLKCFIKWLDFDILRLFFTVFLYKFIELNLDCYRGIVRFENKLFLMRVNFDNDELALKTRWNGKRP